MTATYTPFTTDKDRVRFHTGDVDLVAPIFTDEEIVAIITEAGTWQLAVLYCLDNLIARLAATPDFQADWLKVDISKAIANYRALREQKKETFALEVGTMTSDPVHVYRLDSEQTTTPVYGD